jgi:hypothetical protein
MATFRFQMSSRRAASRVCFARLPAFDAVTGAGRRLQAHVDCAIDQQTAWWIAQSTWCGPGDRADPAGPGGGA